VNELTNFVSTDDSTDFYKHIDKNSKKNMSLITNIEFWSVL